MAFVIPVSSDPAYTFDVDIEGSVYNFEISWNDIGEFWTLHIYSVDNDPILLGVKINLTGGLVRKYKLADLFKGELVAIDSTGTLTKIGRNDLGNLVKIIYITEAELNGVL